MSLPAAIQEKALVRAFRFSSASCFNKVIFAGSASFGHSRGSFLPLSDKMVASDFFSELESLTDANNKVAFVFTSAPFVSLKITQEMEKRISEEDAQIVVCVGYPRGASPVIISSSILPALQALSLSLGGEVQPGFVWKTAQQDINSFDVQALLSPFDFRPQRAALDWRGAEDTPLIEELLRRDFDQTEDILTALREDPSLHSVQPHYVQLQLSSEGWPRESLAVKGSSPDRAKESMPSSVFEKSIALIQALCPNAHISFSWGGDPARCPDVYDYLAAAVERLPEATLLLETSSPDWDSSRLIRIAEQGRGRFIFIAEFFPELEKPALEQLVLSLLDSSGVAPLYVETRLIDDRDEEVRAFQKKWIERLPEGHVLVSPYSHLCGKIRKLSSLPYAPLRRIPCFHLAREIVISAGGEIAFCENDIWLERTLGSVLSLSPQEIWQRAQEIQSQDFAGEHPKSCFLCQDFAGLNF